MNWITMAQDLVNIITISDVLTSGSVNLLVTYVICQVFAQSVSECQSHSNKHPVISRAVTAGYYWLITEGYMHKTNSTLIECRALRAVK